MMMADDVVRRLLLCGLLAGVYSQTKVTKSEDGMSGTISFSTPNLNDEEGHSPFIPSHLKCDACKAVAFQLWDHFNKFNSRHKYMKYNLKESDLLDIVEEVCGNSDVFNSYGIREVKKQNRLHGPGLPDVTEPGMIAGGGKWPSRLQDLCESFMGRIGEEKIYAVYRKEPNSRTKLENFLCRGPADSVRGECSKTKEHVYEGPGNIFGRPDYLDDDDDDDNEGDVKEEL